MQHRFYLHVINKTLIIIIPLHVFNLYPLGVVTLQVYVISVVIQSIGITRRIVSGI